MIDGEALVTVGRVPVEPLGCVRAHVERQRSAAVNTRENRLLQLGVRIAGTAKVEQLEIADIETLLITDETNEGNVDADLERGEEDGIELAHHAEEACQSDLAEPYLAGAGGVVERKIDGGRDAGIHRNVYNYGVELGPARDRPREGQGGLDRAGPVGILPVADIKAVGQVGGVAIAGELAQSRGVVTETDVRIGRGAPVKLTPSGPITGKNCEYWKCRLRSGSS